MPVSRSPAILVVIFVLLALAGPAGAAVSRLTATPPVALTAAAPASPSARTPSSVAGSATGAGSGLPRTGGDVPGELLLAAGLLASGAFLRLRWSTDRT